MAQLFFEAPEKFEDIVDVDQGVLPLEKRRNNVHRPLKSCWSGFKYKSHTGILVQTTMRDEGRVIYSTIIQFYLLIATVGIQCRKYVVWLEAVETFVHSQYGVVSPNRTHIQILLVDAEPQAAILFMCKDELRRSFGCIGFCNDDFQYFGDFVFLQLPLAESDTISVWVNWAISLASWVRCFISDIWPKCPSYIIVNFNNIPSNACRYSL